MPSRRPLPQFVMDKDTALEFESQGLAIPEGTIRADADSADWTSWEQWTGSSWEKLALSPGPARGLTIESPSAGDFPIGRAPAGCTLSKIYIWVDSGGGTINCFKGSVASPTSFLSSDYSTSTTDSWEDGSANLQNTSVSSGDALFVKVVSATASTLAVEMDFTRP